MGTENEFVMVIVVVGLASVVFRAGPMLLLANRELPKRFENLLGHVPLPMITALVALTVFKPLEESTSVGSGYEYLLAAVPTFATAVVSKSLFLSLLVGCSVLACIRLTLG